MIWKCNPFRLLDHWIAHGEPCPALGSALAALAFLGFLRHTCGVLVSLPPVRRASGRASCRSLQTRSSALRPKRCAVSAWTGNPSAPLPLGYGTLACKNGYSCKDGPEIGNIIKGDFWTIFARVTVVAREEGGGKMEPRGSADGPVTSTHLSGEAMAGSPPSHWESAMLPPHPPVSSGCRRRRAVRGGLGSDLMSLLSDRLAATWR
jgi:hypothetical protein